MSFANSPIRTSADKEHLYCESCDLRSVAETFGTPLYVYSRAKLRECASHWNEATKNAKARVFYAMKANSSKAILQEFLSAGIGFDIVSGGELARALAAGANPKNIVYSGVGKRSDEIQAALLADILCFNIESEAELYRVSAIANDLGKTANISFRVNPDVDAKTHPYISTGLKRNKFGIPFQDAFDLYKIAASLPGIRISGIDAHIGSQLTEISPFVDSLEKLLNIVDRLQAAGIFLDHVDIGGGLGICYTTENPPHIENLVQSLQNKLTSRGHGDLSLYFEPGRSLVASCGLLLTRVEYLKANESKNFCIVDASMTEMIRPALYQAEMPLFNCTVRKDLPHDWEIVGPVCESGDWLAKNQALAVRAGDVLVMPNAGAYGMSMASTYNSRVFPAEVMIDGDKALLIRERSTVEDLMQLERSLPTD